MSVLRRLLAGIEWFSERTGKTGAWIALALTLMMSYEVLMRYIFSAPSKWAFDLSWMMFAALIILGLPYVVLHDMNVRMDILYTRWSPRTKLIVDAILTVVVFFPIIYILLRSSIDHTVWSWTASERSRFGYWQPLLWPIRLIVSIGLSILVLQGILWFTRNLLSLLKGKDR